MSAPVTSQNPKAESSSIWNFFCFCRNGKKTTEETSTTYYNGRSITNEDVAIAREEQKKVHGLRAKIEAGEITGEEADIQINRSSEIVEEMTKKITVITSEDVAILPATVAILPATIEKFSVLPAARVSTTLETAPAVEAAPAEQRVERSGTPAAGPAVPVAPVLVIASPSGEAEAAAKKAKEDADTKKANEEAEAAAKKAEAEAATPASTTPASVTPASAALASAAHSNPKKRKAPAGFRELKGLGIDPTKVFAKKAKN